MNSVEKFGCTNADIQALNPNPHPAIRTPHDDSSSHLADRQYRNF